MLLRFVNSILICHEAPDARRVRRERPMSRKLRGLLKVVMKRIVKSCYEIVIDARSQECDRGCLIGDRPLYRPATSHPIHSELRHQVAGFK
jgi:hypothetical protein